MSKREDLRASRAGTIINMSSKKMESLLAKALVEVTTKIEKDFKVKLVHEPKVLLKVIVEHLRIAHPEVDFEYRFPSSYLLPDGGILYICNKKGDKYVLLISEAKRQGTNDQKEMLLNVSVKMLRVLECGLVQKEYFHSWFLDKGSILRLIAQSLTESQRSRCLRL